MKPPTVSQLEELAKRIFDECVPEWKRVYPGYSSFRWDSMEASTRFGWRLVAKWHLEHKDK